MGEGRCVTCGFLAQHFDLGRLHEGPVREVGYRERETGRVVYAVLLCAERFAPLEGEIVSLGGNSQANWDGVGTALHQECVKEVLRRDRKCPLWWEWTEGFAPAWHKEEQKMHLLEKERRAYEERAERERRTFDESLHGQIIRTTVIQIAVGIIAIVVAVTLTAITIHLTQSNPLPVVIATPAAAAPQPTPSTASP